MLPSRFAKLSWATQQSSVEWCERNIYLSPRIPTSEPGQWRARNVAALTLPGGPIEALDDPSCESVVIEKGSQTALTTTSYCWLAKEQDTDPGSALIVMASTQDAREKSAETWRPLFEDSRTLQHLIPASRRKDWTKLYQLVNNSPVYWVGSNSPGRLGAKPIRRLILDEVDKYPKGFGSGSEAGAASLAKQRVKAFRKKGMAKILEYSTPTNDQGEIHLAYLDGDQRKLYVRCHHCGTEQIMVWANFKIDMDLAKTDPGAAVSGAHYECPHCRQHWNDNDRYNAIDKGEWCATAKARDPKCRSFHLPSWCSKFVTHSYLAALWLKAQQSQSSLQDFINSECGEPFVRYDNVIHDSAFLDLEGAYNEGEKWADIEPYASEYKELDRVIIGGVDVQKGYLMAVFHQFVAGGDNGLIWAGDVASMAALEGMADKLGASWIFMDCRYRTHEVNEWCFAHRGYIPCLGVTRRARTLFTVSEVDLDEGRRGQGKTGRIIEQISFDSDMLKDILALQIQRAKQAKRFFIPKGYSSKAEYTAQMQAERCINGRWQPWPSSKPNHYWDATANCLLGAIRLGWWQEIQTQEVKTDDKQ